MNCCDCAKSETSARKPLASSTVIAPVLTLIAATEVSSISAKRETKMRFRRSFSKFVTVADPSSLWKSFASALESKKYSNC